MENLTVFRAHVVAPPISPVEIVTLRCHLQEVVRLKQYKENNIINDQQMEWLEKLIHERKNLLLIGSTGSGKTTLLNSLIQAIGNKHRLVILEDTPEIVPANSLSTKLLTRDKVHNSNQEISLQELVRQSLRMRPDRLVLGEVRGAEAKDLLMALATGHPGSLGTIHAETAPQALYRLEMLIQMGAPQWSVTAIRQLIQMSLSHLVVIKKTRSKAMARRDLSLGGSRRVDLSIG